MELSRRDILLGSISLGAFAVEGVQSCDLVEGARPLMVSVTCRATLLPYQRRQIQTYVRQQLEHTELAHLPVMVSDPNIQFDIVCDPRTE